MLLEMLLGFRLDLLLPLELDRFLADLVDLGDLETFGGSWYDVSN